MKKTFSYLFTLSVVVLLLSSCASYHVRQGNRFYRDMAYSEATKEYQKALGKKSFPEAQIKLAESYRLMNDLSKSEEAYSRVMQLAEVEPEHRLRYAQLLMRSGKYDQAKNYFDQYLGSRPNDQAALQQRQSCDSIASWKQDSARYTIEPSKLNTGGSNFSPVWYRDGVVFVSDRNAKAKTYVWTGRPFLDLYYSKKDQSGNYGMAMPLQGDVNGMYHEGPAAFNSKGDTMYFTRNSYMKRKAEKSEEDVVILQLYEAINKDTSFSQVSSMTLNSKEYSTGHPSLSSDGQVMYFTSDMPGGQGGSDIYMSRKQNGQWSAAKNLGPNINTPYNESFPMLWNDSLLYFSSEGHYGMGGLDVFYSSTDESGNWSRAQNMGYPFNSSYDDFGVAMNAEGTEGLLSSNRNTQNTQQDQIYGFKINDLRFTLEGIAVEKQSQKPLSGVVVELSNRKTAEKERVTTGEDGKFFFKLNPNTDYSVVGSKDSYFTNTEPVSTVGKLQSENMYVKLKLEMEQIIVNKPIVLENIYYDLDKYDIREDAAIGLNKLVSIMEDNPEINIELSSHTDSRADDRYNMTLSQRRAESAVNYIVSKGVSKDRITAKGYGETMLVNRCSNKVDCSEEEHQANRRTEFKVTSMKK
ncbi:MAG TPA: OmpA family protein [Bacteroidia bacterium]|nr:OmpA family protein [Bacteroidia bacterium]HNS11389.1 OmpA family protein [Bacteroidia bacterium]